jgi:hypothetical protein
MLFSTDKYRFLGNASANHFLSLLHQTRACNASQRRDLTWELKGGITFYSLVCFSFLESYRRTAALPFENAQVANPCPEHFLFSTSLNWLPKPDFQYFGNVYSKRSFVDFLVFDI